MFSQYRTVSASECLVLPEGLAPRDGASAFINPMTALAMVETMRREGHTALVNTAAASMLGQMLNRLCQTDNVPLVNIVRSDEQARTLRSAGARFVVNSSAPEFKAQLLDAIDQTGATLAFDAIGGGTMASDILHAMDQSQSRKATGFSRYGSPVHRQVYIYGLLNTDDRILRQNIGTSWGVGGWLMSWQLRKFGEETKTRFNRRIVSELKTTFRTDYGEEIRLADLLRLDRIGQYRKPRFRAEVSRRPSSGLSAARIAPRAARHQERSLCADPPRSTRSGGCSNRHRRTASGCGEICSAAYPKPIRPGLSSLSDPLDLPIDDLRERVQGQWDV
jgi:hypothetical protein